MNNNIFEQEISAEELYKELQSFGKLNDLIKHYIFRGVASNNYELAENFELDISKYDGVITQKEISGEVIVSEVSKYAGGYGMLK